jgi:ribonucleoside-diphosphate reductase beta chain
MDNYIFSMALKEHRYVIKRNGETVLFESEKIKNAIIKSMASIDKIDVEMADKIARLTTKGIFKGDKDRVPHVDEIHDMVENKLMDNGLNDVAKEYIIYRSKHRPNIFNKRTNLKPYEYPNLSEYVDAIRHSYWVHTEFNFTSDIQDFKVHLSEKEQTAVQRAMLAISQIELAVKSCWGDM